MFGGAVEMVAHVGNAAGLHPELMLAGAAGGWLAHTYQPPAEFAARFTRVILSALAATWCTPLAVHLLQLPAEPGLVKFPLALGFGLLTMDVLGHGVIAFARKWFKGKSDG